MGLFDVGGMLGGAFQGALLGATYGGPVGFVVGGAGGALLGKKVGKQVGNIISPPVPKVPGMPEVPSAAAVYLATLEDRRKRALMGRASTVLTGSNLGAGTTASHTLLGQ